MRFLTLLAITLLIPTVALAQYDVTNRNIYNDVDTMTVDEAGANDFMQVFRVTNTNTGTGSSEKIALENVIPNTEDLTEASTLTTADCGKTLLLNAATEFATTLPSPAAGCKLHFIVKAAPASASYTVVTASSANILIGGINELEVDTGDDGAYDNNGDTITFVDGVAVVGDYVEMISDGTSWYLHGQANADGGITVAGS